MRILVTLPLHTTQKSQMEALVPHWSIEYSSYGKATAQMVANADILIGNVPVALLSAAQSLKWMQLFSSGATGYSDVLPEEVLLTCATGTYGTGVSEHMLALLLAVLKKLPTYMENQLESIWTNPIPPQMIAGSTVLVVGTGDIGASFARIVQAMEAQVLGCKRTPAESIAGFDALYTIEELDSIIPLADVIALALPGTEATHHLFDGRRLRMMKDNAVLINVGRGSVIDSEALCDVLHEGHLAAAALDVFEEEPLPKNHCLWQAPRLFITPHAAGSLVAGNTIHLLFDIVMENLRRYRDGEPLIHTVDRKTGYLEVANDRN